jgi:hypothetical protein
MTKKKLNLIIEKGSHYYPCGLNKFVVNGIDAMDSEFGSISQDPQDEPWTCKNRRFNPAVPTDALLKKYHINLDEYALICQELQTALYVSRCGMCV